MAKIVKVDALKAYRNLQAVLKKIRIIGNDFVVCPDGVITFKRIGVESFAIINEEYTLNGHLEWMFSTCEKFFADIKANDIKVKGTTVEEFADSIHIYKDGEKVASYEKLGYSHDVNLEMAHTFYKFLPKFINDILGNTLKWSDLTPDEKDAMMDGDVITLQHSNASGDFKPAATIAIELIPLMKSTTEVSYAFLGPLADDKKNQAFVMRERYPEATIYTLAAFMII